MPEKIEMYIRYDNENIKRQFEIDITGKNEIFLTIRKNVKGLEHEFEDVLLTKDECESLGRLLIFVSKSCYLYE